MVSKLDWTINSTQQLLYSLTLFYLFRVFQHLYCSIVTFYEPVEVDVILCVGVWSSSNLNQADAYGLEKLIKKVGSRRLYKRRMLCLSSVQPLHSVLKGSTLSKTLITANNCPRATQELISTNSHYTLQFLLLV